QVAQTQKSTANANARFQALEEQLTKLTGLVEESAHNRQQEIKENALLKERMQNLEESNKKQNDYIRSLNEKMQDQSKYIEQVVKSLSSLNEQKEKEREAASKKKESKEENSDHPATLKSGIAQYKAHDLEAAKATLTSVLENKKTKKKDKEAAYHFLGMIEYKNKNFEEAQVYFSKLFSENPESNYAASALLNLAKSFAQMKSKDEAKQSLDELITRFPKSKEASEGAKLKAKL
ncbi:MAG: tetratricopeptide repeat protein, partial [Bacteriovorax sp.]